MAVLSETESDFVTLSDDDDEGWAHRVWIRARGQLLVELAKAHFTFFFKKKTKKTQQICFSLAQIVMRYTEIMRYMRLWDILCVPWLVGQFYQIYENHTSWSWSRWNSSLCSHGNSISETITKLMANMAETGYLQSNLKGTKVNEVLFKMHQLSVYVSPIFPNLCVTMSKTAPNGAFWYWNISPSTLNMQTYTKQAWL